MKKLRTIEAYLSGELKGQELRNFRAELASNPALADEVDFNRDINESIIDEEIVNIRNIIRNVILKKQVISRKINLTKRIVIYASAASIALLIVMNLPFQKQADNNQIFNNYYEPYNPDITLRSTTLKKNSVQFAYKLYQDKEYGAAFQILDNYLHENHEDQTARFYLGMCALEMDKNGTAIDAFREIIDSESDSPFEEHAKWYLGLTYMKLEKTDSARMYFNTIVEEEGYHADAASEILKDINE